MSDELSKTKQAYAELILRCGVNLQPGESVIIRPELGHREFVRLLVATAYDLGARFVMVEWSDPLSTRARYQHCLLYTSPSPRDRTRSRMPSSA